MKIYMNKMMKKLIAAGSTLALLTNVGVALAVDSDLNDDQSTVINQSVTAGALTIQAPVDTSMSSVQVSSAEQTSTGEAVDLKIDDARGAKPVDRLGWSATVTSTDFDDAATKLPGDALSTLPVAGHFTVTPNELEVGTDTLSTGVSLGSEYTLLGTSDPATVATSVATNGNGRYIMDLGLSLLVDENPEAAVYAATMTFTVS